MAFESGFDVAGGHHRSLSEDDAEERPSTGASCSDLERYVQWLEEFAKVCRPEEGGDLVIFENCDWVNCECLWGSLSAPVPDNEVVPCFEQGMKVERISTYAQQFSYALMQTCRARTLELSKPCGECDQYRKAREECLDLTEEELRLRNGTLNATNSTNGSGVTTKRAKSSGAAPRRAAAGGFFLLHSAVAFLVLPALLLS